MGCSSSKSETVHVKDPARSRQTDQENLNQYQKIDEHARKAPNSVKNSTEELVNYMSSVSKDPRLLTRGFFIWISENIRYDVDGYFERAKKAPCDAESVMKGGSTVCEGYANVMELLCRHAGVPVKKISGYAKGYGHSAANPITLETDTNHAWNAVQLEGKWYLLDSTWGAGHLDTTNSFQKEFEEFYFLTDPKHFISTHFPYMDKNMEESKKWQLLAKPISLEQFNKNVKYKPTAFKLGAQAVSHPQGYVEMKNELQMTFKSVGKEDIVYSARLMLKEENILQQKPNATFGYPENGLFKLLIHPPKSGTYRMNVFGQGESEGKLQGIPELMEYTINCTEVKEKDFEYPISYTAAGSEKTILHEPLRGKLPANKEVKFRVSAPHLQHVMVGDTYLEKSGTMFSGNVKTDTAGQKIGLYGTRGDKYGKLQGLYAFHTV
ncbi:kyphoscoliosis peptidase-like [Mercenaria mercenaria]|uniref:kyphoscoliosis peptidase-like n=1 Tax=Mercenaria mercenaria TaxID=6596 RepID=UPI00234EA5FA|nr:kyphoscoliosis peptidase-like [Mercenaria mercenaria]